MRDMSGSWVKRDGKCHRTPFQAGVDRALIEAFPPVEDSVLPARIAAAIQALERLGEVTLGDRSAGTTR